MRHAIKFIAQVPQRSALTGPGQIPETADEFRHLAKTRLHELLGHRQAFAQWHRVQRGCIQAPDNQLALKILRFLTRRLHSLARGFRQSALHVGGGGVVCRIA